MNDRRPQDRPSLALESCQARLDRLRTGLAEAGAEAAVIHEPDVIRWAIGCTSMHGWPGVLVVTADEAVAFLFATGQQASIATEQVVLRGISRERVVRHHAELAVAAGTRLRGVAAHGRPIGVDTHAAPAWITAALAEAGAARSVDIAALIVRLRRRKDEDELAIIEHNVALSAAAFGAASECIRPGRTELDVYTAISGSIVDAAATSVTFGGDFMAGPGGGERGGPPGERVLRAGDSYVLDFFPNQAGYWADMCRTYPIGEPSSELMEALRVTREALELAETLIRPGLRVSELDAALRAHLSAWQPSAGDYFHLTGHGIGMRPHEAPWLVAQSDEVLEVGDVIAVEPGVYHPALRGGVRIEDDYVVVEDGIRRLGDVPR